MDSSAAVQTWSWVLTEASVSDELAQRRSGIDRSTYSPVFGNQISGCKSPNFECFFFIPSPTGFLLAMTRYTNLGRKRTYLEAGFSNDNAELTPGDVRNKSADDNTDGELESQPSQPPAKKQKRVRQKKSKKDDKTSEKAEGKGNDALADHTENDERKQVKQAYSKQSREKNRRSWFSISHSFPSIDALLCLRGGRQG